MKIGKRERNYLYFGLFVVFLIVSYFVQYKPGIEMGRNFYIFARDMLLILPPAFVLIGLFEVWAKRETIEKHLGENSKFRAYFWSILLAATTVGGTFVAFPVANSLYHKGARYSMIMTYVTSASLVMIPMSIMEASILGLKFTATRLLVSLPLVILSSILLERIFLGMNYKLPSAQSG
ncbi:MAG TPA: hypothetical protein ENN41_06955 [Sediminispirochaeta sp.]|nr:hypothetical protein [Sediminispirochaeta sp.]